MTNKMLFIEDGHNTCYINSLLTGLFYVPSIIHTKLLEEDPKNIYFVYLQEIIKNSYVDYIRKGIPIMADTVNEIRNFCFFSGFSSNIAEKHNVSDYLNFIVSNISPIDQKIIDLDISTEKTNIKKLLNEKTSDFLPNNLHHRLYMIPIYINRYVNGTKLDTKVDIKRKIMIENSKYRWVIHCVICHNGENLIDGYHYVIMSCNNKWILFDDRHIPSFQEIDMRDKLIVDKIMKECVLLIYKMM